MLPEAKPRALMAWSSGKDSAWALHVMRDLGEVEIAGLLTTFNSAFDRVAMHAVRRELVEAQAEAVGLPLLAVPLPWPCSNAQYEAALWEALEAARSTLRISCIVFGDLFLEDVRRYRETMFAGSGLTPLFPLWDLPTARLAREMVESGLRARITCLDPLRLPASFAGRSFDATLLDELPTGVDPCGEAGEFHTFVYDGPMFAHPVPVEAGEVVERDRFVFADLLPAT